MRKIKAASVLLTFMFLFSACGNDSGHASKVTEKEAVEKGDVQIPVQTGEGESQTDREPNPISDFDYTYDFDLQGVVVSYKGESERVRFPSEINGDPVVAVGETKSRKAVRQVYIPDGVRQIGYNAFRDCKNLESVSIPDSVAIIDGYAFYECSALKSVKLPPRLESIGTSAFKGTSISEIEFPEGLEEIGLCAFENCKEIRSVIIPASVNTIGPGAFENCEKLAEIKLADQDAVIHFGDEEVFEGTYWYNKQPEGFLSLGHNLVALKGKITGNRLVIPEGTKSIAAFITKDKGIENVTEIVLPEGLELIGASAFAFAESLKTVNVPESIKYIDNYAFLRAEILDEETRERLLHYNASVFTENPEPQMH